MKQKIEIEAGARLNTDVEVWRKQGDGPGDPDNFYQPSIKITKGQGVMLCVGGTCITKPIEDWFQLAGLCAGDGVYYIPQERAMAPGISGEWPDIIPHPTNPHGRLIKTKKPSTTEGKKEDLKDVL